MPKKIRKTKQTKHFGGSGNFLGFGFFFISGVTLWVRKHHRWKKLLRIIACPAIIQLGWSRGAEISVDWCLKNNSWILKRRQNVDFPQPKKKNLNFVFSDKPTFVSMSLQHSKAGTTSLGSSVPPQDKVQGKSANRS